MEEKLEDQKCEICKEVATNMCFECSFYLCDNCFEFIHNKNANLDHKKENINLFNSFDIRCPKHPRISLNLFCKEEKSKIYIFNFYNNI